MKECRYSLKLGIAYYKIATKVNGINYFQHINGSWLEFHELISIDEFDPIVSDELFEILFK